MNHALPIGQPRMWTAFIAFVIADLIATRKPSA